MPAACSEAACAGGQGQHVGVRRQAGDLAAAAHDVAWTGLTEALRDGLRHLFGRAVLEYPHRVNAAQQELLRTHGSARIGQGDHGIDVDDVAAQAPHLRQAALRVATDVQADPGAGFMQPIHQPFLEGPDELIVEARADQRGGGIADADEISAGLHLRAAEGDAKFEREFEEVPDEGIQIRIGLRSLGVFGGS